MPALRPTFHTRNLGRFGSLLGALLLVFVLAPFSPDDAEGITPVSILYTVVMVVGAYAVSRRRRVFWVGLWLAIAAIASEWISHFVLTTPLVLANLSLSGVFSAYVAGVVLYEVLQEDRVTLDTIAGGIAVYLLIGVGWVMIYAAIEHLHHGAFLLHGQPLGAIHSEVQIRYPELLYFSFVTLTTLGYGDVVPSIPHARAAATGEAVVGQLYVAVFVARLVGLHLASQQLARGSRD